MRPQVVVLDSILLIGRLERAESRKERADHARGEDGKPRLQVEGDRVVRKCRDRQDDADQPLVEVQEHRAEQQSERDPPTESDHLPYPFQVSPGHQFGCREASEERDDGVGGHERGEKAADPEGEERVEDDLKVQAEQDDHDADEIQPGAPEDCECVCESEALPGLENADLRANCKLDR